MTNTDYLMFFLVGFFASCVIIVLGIFFATRIPMTQPPRPRSRYDRDPHERDWILTEYGWHNDSYKRIWNPLFDQ